MGSVVSIAKYINDAPAQAKADLWAFLDLPPNQPIQVQFSTTNSTPDTPDPVVTIEFMGHREHHAADQLPQSVRDWLFIL